MARMRVLDDEWIYEGAAARERLQEIVPPAQAVKARRTSLIRQVLDFVFGVARG